jgi:plasmid stabilization system protein ParE
VYIVILLEEADEDLVNAVRWYNDKSEGLGLKFLDAIKKKLEIIRQFPERYPIRKGKFRETPLKTFPYLIVYTFHKDENVVFITSIFHASQRPSKKYRK